MKSHKTTISIIFILACSMVLSIDAYWRNSITKKKIQIVKKKPSLLIDKGKIGFTLNVDSNTINWNLISPGDFSDIMGQNISGEVSTLVKNVEILSLERSQTNDEEVLITFNIEKEKAALLLIKKKSNRFFIGIRNPRDNI